MDTMKSAVQRLRFPLEIMLVCVRWYVAYPLSLRNLEEMMQERGVKVDHSTIHRWVLKLVPVLEATFRQRKAAVGTSWRMDAHTAVIRRGIPEIDNAIAKRSISATATFELDRRHGWIAVPPSAPAGLTLH